MGDVSCNCVKSANLSDLEVYFHFFFLKNCSNIILSYPCQNSQRSISKRFARENAEFRYFFLLLRGLFILFRTLYIPVGGTDDLRSYSCVVGDRGSTVVKVLCYKSEGRWFDPGQSHWNFSLT